MFKAASIYVSADMLRIATLCTSNEETRYYLNGVAVFPAPSGDGVLLVATDGHRMIVLHDAGGYCGADCAGAIIANTSPVLKNCKSKLTGLMSTQFRRSILIDCSAGNTGEKLAIHADTDCTLRAGGDITATGTSAATLIDGTFPDFYRVVPRLSGDASGLNVGTFNAFYIGTFAAIANELAKLRGARNGLFSIAGQDASSPALVKFSDAPAFGVLMPLRSEFETATLPDWFTARPAPIAAPAESEALAA
jgi:hypothetical protein